MNRLILIIVTFCTFFVTQCNRTLESTAVPDGSAIVYEPDGTTPSEGAIVKLFNPAFNPYVPAAICTTGSDGRYKLPKLEEGIYCVWIQNDSLVCFQDSLHINYDNNVLRDDTLEKSSTFSGRVKLDNYQEAGKVSIALLGSGRPPVFADSNGNFTLSGLPSGSLQITINCANSEYLPTNSNISINTQSGTTEATSFVLYRSSISRTENALIESANDFSTIGERECEDGARECGDFNDENGWTMEGNCNNNCEPISRGGKCKSNCVAWAWYKSGCHKDLKSLGDAKYWASGFPECETVDFCQTCWSRTPSVGTIAVNENGITGHVSYVVKTDGQNAIVSEYNVIPCAYSYGRKITPDENIKYIYLDGKSSCESNHRLIGAYVKGTGGGVASVTINASGPICPNVTYALYRRINSEQEKLFYPDIKNVLKPFNDLITDCTPCDTITYILEKKLVNRAKRPNLSQTIISRDSVRAYLIAPPSNLTVVQLPENQSPYFKRFTWVHSPCRERNIKDIDYILSCQCGISDGISFSRKINGKDFFDTLLTPNAQYKCSLVAHYNGDISEPVETILYTGSEYPVMVAPVNSISGCNLNVRWKVVTCKQPIRGYQINIYLNDNTTAPLINTETINDPQQSSYTIDMSDDKFIDGNYSAAIRVIPAIGSSEPKFSTPSNPVLIDCRQEAPMITITPQCGANKISWTFPHPAQNIKSYSIWRRPVEDPTLERVIADLTNNATEYSDKTVAKIQYEYCVKVAYTQGQNMNSKWTLAPENHQLAPEITKLTSDGKNINITITDRSLGESSFSVTRTANGGIPKEVAHFENGTGTGSIIRFDDQPELKNTVYTYTAIAHFNTCQPSETATIAFLDKPSGVQVNKNEKGLQVCWNTVRNADGYVIFRKINDGVVTEIARSGLGSTCFTDSFTVDGNTLYSYMVRAFSGKDLSINSSEISDPATYGTIVQCKAELPSCTITAFKCIGSILSVTFTGDDAQTDGYLIDYSSGNTWIIGQANIVASGTTTIGNVMETGNVSVRVRGFITENGSKCYSPVDEKKSIKSITILPPPDKLSCQTTDNITGTVTWIHPEAYPVSYFNLYQSPGDIVYKIDRSIRKQTVPLTCGVMNEFTIAAFNTSGESYVESKRSSPAVLEIKEPCPPPPPASFKVTNEAGNARLSWVAITGCEGYSISRDGKPLVTVKGTDNTYLDDLPDEKCDISYAYTIRSKNTNGYGPQSAEQVFKKQCSPAAPVLNGAMDGNSVVNLSWSSVPCNLYEIFVNGEKNKIIKYPETKATIDVIGYTCGTPVKMHVKAHNEWGYSKASNEKTFTKNAPGAPVITKITLENGKPVIWWNQVTGATIYHIFKEGKQIGTSTTTNYTDLTKVECTNNYTVKAAGYGCIGDVSAVKEYTPKPGAPRLTATYVSGNNFVDLNWTQAANASSYILEGKVLSSGSFTTLFNGTGLSQKVTVSESGKEYVYRVVGHCATNGDYSNLDTIKTCLKPAAPQLKTAYTSGNNYVDLSWNAIAGATSYTLEKKISSQNSWTTSSLGNVTKYHDESVVSGTTYHYRIRVFSCMFSDYSNEVKASVVFSTCNTPVAPVLYDPQNVYGSSIIHVTWSAIANADRYELHRKESSSGTYDKVYEVSQPSYTDIAECNKSYTYKVRSYGCESHSAFSNEKNVSIQCTAPCVSPGQPELNDLGYTPGSNVINVTWQNVNAKSYELERSNNDAGPYEQVYNEAGTSFVDHVGCNKKYIYRVRAFGCDVYSRYSNTQSVTTQCDPSSCITPVFNPFNYMPGSLVVNVTWKDDGNSSSYDLQRKAGSGDFVSVYTGSDPSYIDRDIVKNITYYYKVKGSGCNEFSNTVPVSAN